MHKLYQSKKNNKIAELIGENEHGVIILLDDGDERILAPSTFKRWWKPLELHEEETAVAKEPQQEPVKELPSVEPILEATDNKLHQQFLIAAEKLAQVYEAELFVRPDGKSYNFRKNGRIYFVFILNKEFVTIRAKSKAIGEKYAYTAVNHNFDVSIKVKSWDSTTYEMLRELHNMSLTYQLSKEQSTQKK